VTIADSVLDLECRLSTATHPREWIAIFLRLHALEQRLPLPRAGRRPVASHHRALGRLIAAFRDRSSSIPSDWRDEIMRTVGAIADRATSR
jgi:hypothetical protein